MAVNCKASARKSLGEFKPLIVYSDGSTEVCEKSPERSPQYIRGEGMVAGKRYARGTTYTVKADAVAAAQAVIDARLAEAQARLADFEANAPEHLREKLCARVRNEIEAWGGAPVQEKAK